MTDTALRSRLEVRYNPEHLDLERLQANLADVEADKAEQEEALPVLARNEPSLAIMARANIATFDEQIAELRALIEIKREWQDAQG